MYTAPPPVQILQFTAVKAGIRRRNPILASSRNFKKKPYSSEQHSNSNSKFFRCGQNYSKDHESQCRAKDVHCNKCGKKAFFTLFARVLASSQKDSRGLILLIEKYLIIFQALQDKIQQVITGRARLNPTRIFEVPLNSNFLWSFCEYFFYHFLFKLYY